MPEEDAENRRFYILISTAVHVLMQKHELEILQSCLDKGCGCGRAFPRSLFVVGGVEAKKRISTLFLIFLFFIIPLSRLFFCLCARIVVCTC